MRSSLKKGMWRAAFVSWIFPSISFPSRPSAGRLYPSCAAFALSGA